MNAIESTSDFLIDTQTIAYDLCKCIIIDASMLKYKPSILAAVTVYLGFLLNFDLLVRKKQLELKTAEGRMAVNQLAQSYRIWIDLLENMLEMAEVPKVELFSEHVLSRCLMLKAEYKDQFVNVFKERTLEYLTAAPPRSDQTSKTQSSPVRSHQPLPMCLATAHNDRLIRNQPPMLIDETYPTQQLNYESDSLVSSTDHQIDVEMVDETNQEASLR